MTTQSLLEALAAARVRLWPVDGRLRFRAPTGAFTPELRTAAVDRQREILELLVDEACGGLPARVQKWPEEWRHTFEERAGIMEFDGGLDRELAEREAERCVRGEYARATDRGTSTSAA